MSFKWPRIEYIWLAFIFVSALVVYGVQYAYSAEPMSTREQVIYRGVEFALAAALGWTLQRIESERQYKDSLKRFALSAYRRISDLDKSVKSLFRSIERARTRYPADKPHELDIIRVIVDEMANGVGSSLADWTEVIGEELNKKGRLQALEREREALAKVEPTSEVDQVGTAKLEEISREIQQLRSELPYMFTADGKVLSQFPNDEIYPRDGTVLSTLVESYLQQVISSSSVVVRVALPAGVESINVESIAARGPFYFSVEQNMFQLYAMVYDRYETYVGRVVNPYRDVYQNDFVVTIATVLGAITKVTGSLSVVPATGTRIPLERATVETLQYAESQDAEILLRIPATQMDFAYG